MKVMPMMGCHGLSQQYDIINSHVGLVGNSILRDYESDCDWILLDTPIRSTIDLSTDGAFDIWQI